MRVVLDTNVVVSALLWRGVPFKLFEAIRERAAIKLFTSPTLLQELAEVMQRPFAVTRLEMIRRSLEQVISDYAAAVELVTPAATPRLIKPDADDDHVIAAAASARADLIVSGDRHLLGFAVYLNIRIVSPVNALRLLPPASAPAAN